MKPVLAAVLTAPLVALGALTAPATAAVHTPVGAACWWDQQIRHGTTGSAPVTAVCRAGERVTVACYARGETVIGPGMPPDDRWARITRRRDGLTGFLPLQGLRFDDEQAVGRLPHC